LKIKIISKKLNPLLKRKEVVFEVDHTEEGQTPSRVELLRELARELKTKLDLVFIEKVETKTGTTTAIGEANTYESAEQAKLVERDHILTRNTPPETAATGEKQEAKEPASKEQETKALKSAGEDDPEATQPESEQEEKEKQDR